jgi:hypothetical protein
VHTTTLASTVISLSPAMSLRCTLWFVLRTSHVPKQLVRALERPHTACNVTTLRAWRVSIVTPNCDVQPHADPMTGFAIERLRLCMSVVICITNVSLFIFIALYTLSIKAGNCLLYRIVLDLAPVAYFSNSLTSGSG